MPTLIEILSDPSANWKRESPAGNDVIESLERGCDFKLPEEYLALLRYSNGGEGELCLEPWWFRLWPAEDLLLFNKEYEVNIYLPEYFGIGSNGGGEILAIRKSDGSPCPIYMIPFLFPAPGSESEIIQICYDMEMFAMAMGREPSH